MVFGACGGRAGKISGRGCTPGSFCEVVENKGLIFSRVGKSAKERRRHDENKGVSGSRGGHFCEVAVNTGLRGIIGWAGEWGDAVRRTEGVAANIKVKYHMSDGGVKENRDAI